MQNLLVIVIALTISSVVAQEYSAVTSSNDTSRDNNGGSGGGGGGVSDATDSLVVPTPALAQGAPQFNFINTSGCRIRSTDEFVSNRIKDLIKMRVKLIEFNLDFEQYDVNPLSVNNTWTYRGTRWARAYSQHGQTLLSLAFNYGIMSLMTLTLGVEHMNVPLVDEPHGCVAQLNESSKVSTVMYLLMRDFDDTAQDITLEDQERICHEIIENRGGGVAKFTDQCCHVSPITQELICSTDIINIWLKMLLLVLVSVKFILLFFGPLWFIPFIESIAKEDYPYVVDLKDPLVKTVMFCNSDTHIDKTYEKVLDLRGKRGYPKLKESLKQHVPIGEPVKVKFKRYDILVNYKKLLVENDVPVGLLQSIGDAMCKCKIRNIGPFTQCCSTDMFKGCAVVEAEKPWIDLFKVVAKVLMVLLGPFPFYIRLYIFYNFEETEINNRQAHLQSLNMRSQYEGSILTYLTPTHWMFIAIYVTYFFTAIVLGLVAKGQRKEKLASIIVGSFRDLKNLSYLDALGLLVGNVIWPFKRFGIVGCLVAPVYWIIVLPITLVVYVFYCLPTIYVAFRMLWRVKTTAPAHHHPSGRYKVVKEYDRSMHKYEMENLVERLHSTDADNESDVIVEKKHKRRVQRRFFENLALSVLCVLTMFSVLIVMSEVVGFLVEIGVFTMMGVIVNAGAVLKYVTLLILVVVYSYDTYNNVGKKYLKLNKALFNEVKGRCKNIDVVTSMPSHLQENHGFKSQELGEQADYEESDGIAEDRKLQWMINDLVLFVDNEDMPRIPQKLFQEVCQIRVAGAPGPVHQAMIEATQEFLKIMVFIFFVFVVVLTFGAVYQVSSTNQMLAALAGGFLPFIMKTFMAPTKPDIEIGTVSFKSKLDEIIKNFNQKWVIYDFPFELWTEEDEKEKQEKEKGDDAASTTDDDKKSQDENKDDITGDAAKDAKPSVKQTDVNANMSVIGETFHDALDHSGAPFRNLNNNSGFNHPPPLMTSHNIEMKAFEPNNMNLPFADQTSSPQRPEFTPFPVDSMPTAAGEKAAEAAAEETEEAAAEPTFDIDILVYLPDAAKRSSDKWLAEWSDLDSYDERDDDIGDDDAEEEDDQESVHSRLQRKRRKSKDSNNLRHYHKMDIV